MQYEGVRYTEGSIQIAMEFMDGGSLGDLVQRVGPLPAAAMASITRQTLCALAALRELHLVHRDLKPQAKRAPPRLLPTFIFNAPRARVWLCTAVMAVVPV